MWKDARHWIRASGMVLFSFCFLLFSACKTDEHVTYRVNGCLVIENHTKIVRSAKSRLRLQESFSIGAESSDANYVFYGGLKVRVDSRRNIYVLDAKDCRISKYSAQGDFIWRVAGKGQGPGEFENPADFSIGRGDDLFVLDMPSTIEVFSSDGVFKRDIRLDKPFCSIDALDDGRFLLNELAMDQTGVVAYVYSSAGHPERQVAEPYRYGPRNLGRGGFSSEKAFRYVGDKFFFSLPDRYEIREYDLMGNMRRIIRRKISLSPFNIKTEEGVITALSVKDRSGPCFLWKDGYIINILTLHLGPGKREWFMDLFDKDGYYVGSVSPPDSTYVDYVDRDGGIYLVQRSPYPKVICCRLLLGDYLK